ncbi:MAG: hypothetical protein OXB97_03645 [Rhodospirillales bacterium]|nr:hypothetical protein [Rhodospirillales bacterium]
MGGQKPFIDVNPRRSVDVQEALKREKKARRTLGLVFPEERRYVVRSGSERVNGRLKDEFGGRHVRVRGYDKILAHLMFGMTVLTASQLMRLIVPPIRSGSSPSSSPQPHLLRGAAAKRARSSTDIPNRRLQQRPSDHGGH